MQVQILPPLPDPPFSTDDFAPKLETEQLPAYSYLLGMDLGDGYLCRMARTYRLEIYLYWRDESGIATVGSAIRALLPTHKVGRERPGGDRLFQGLARILPAAWPRIQAQPADRPHAMAADDL